MRKIFVFLFAGGAMALSAYFLISAGEWISGYPNNPRSQVATGIEAKVRLAPKQPRSLYSKTSTPTTQADLQVPMQGILTKVSDSDEYSYVVPKLFVLADNGPANLELLNGAKIRHASAAVQASESVVR